MNLPAQDQPCPLKVCPACGAVWHSCPDLVGDPDIELQGYQAGLTPDGPGLMLFRHRPCGTTLALELRSLHPVVAEPLLGPSKGPQPRAPDFCLAWRDQEPCPRQCVCQFVSTVVPALQKMARRLSPKPEEKASPTGRPR